MKGQTRILQQRVQILTIKRRERKTDKRVRCKNDKANEGHSDRPLHSQSCRPKSIRQITAKPRRTGPEQCEDEHPEQHRPFMVSPCAADFIDQWF